MNFYRILNLFSSIDHQIIRHLNSFSLLRTKHTPLMDHRKSLGKLLSWKSREIQTTSTKNRFCVYRAFAIKNDFICQMAVEKKKQYSKLIALLVEWFHATQNRRSEQPQSLFYRKRNVFPANSSTLCVNRSSAGTQLLESWTQLNRVEPQATIRKDVY